MNQPYSILLVDDEKLLVESLEIILTLSTGYTIYGKAYHGMQALELLQHNAPALPNLALIDLNMERMGGLELIKHLRSSYPSIQILVLTTFYDEANIAAAISLGANGYLLKDSGKDAILSAVLNLQKGQSVLDAKVLEQLSHMMSRTIQEPKKEPVLLDALTKREQEICSMLAEGYTNAQIASLLFISEGTVKNYISSIYDKFDIHDRAALAVRLSNYDCSHIKS